MLHKDSGPKQPGKTESASIDAITYVVLAKYPFLIPEILTVICQFRVLSASFYPSFMPFLHGSVHLGCFNSFSRAVICRESLSILDITSVSFLSMVDITDISMVLIS